jgi:hypothetical protein
VRSLVEFQRDVRCAVIGGGVATPGLVGGTDPSRRLAIHRRHYEASLTRALTEKFPATVWLVGSDFVGEAARRFVRRHPPAMPCITEYGEMFPAFLAAQPGAERVPWLRWISELEWHLGHAVLAIEHPPFALADAARTDPMRLVDCALCLQPGLRYIAAPWPVDELVQLFLAEQAPQHYPLDCFDVHLEIRGVRGSFSIARLDIGQYEFRSQLAAGAPVGAAGERALGIDPAFDAGTALSGLFAAGLVVAIGLAEPVA